MDRDLVCVRDLDRRGGDKDTEFDLSDFSTLDSEPGSDPSYKGFSKTFTV